MKTSAELADISADCSIALVARMKEHDLELGEIRLVMALCISALQQSLTLENLGHAATLKNLAEYSASLHKRDGDEK